MIAVFLIQVINLCIFLVLFLVLPAVSSGSGLNNSTDLVQVFDARKSIEMSAEISGSAELSLEGNQLSGQELPFYSFNAISVATNNFSEENKLGQGGFGPVYKVKILLLSLNFYELKA